MSDRLLIGTRKGLVTATNGSSGYALDAIGLRGLPVAYAAAMADGSWWASVDMGHWGPKVRRSTDEGATWAEVEPPRYPERTGAALESIWVIAPGHPDQPGRMWMGTFPGGLFRSDDHGQSWDLVDGLWDHPSRAAGLWFGGGRDSAGVHSVVVDPRDPNRVLVAVSVAGVFESIDDGASWAARNRGLSADFLPDPEVEAGHDPHLLKLVPGAPDVLWQQNHCGIFRSVDGARTWTEISQPAGPARFGFPIAVHDSDPDLAWVVPAESDEIRTTLDGSLVVCRTEDGGRSWQELRAGLPQEHAYDVVYRHALDRRGDELVFGSTTGNVYWSGDGGDHWDVLAQNLPPVYSVQWA
jgi:photosystem II stability/assembly factor-like uncharacterized protein